MEENEEKIKLSDILEKCLEFRQNPTEDAFKEAGKIIAMVDVRERLSLAEKGLSLISMLEGVKDNDNPIECAFDLTAGFFFKGLLSYATNLLIDIPQTMMNIETYDLLVALGFEDHMLKYCEKDVRALRKMLDDAVNFSNLYRLVNVSKLISPEGVAELDKVIRDLKETLSIEKIRELKGLLVESDPAWSALKESVGEDIVFAKTVDDVAKLDGSLQEAEGEPLPEENEGDGEPEEAKEDGSAE